MRPGEERSKAAARVRELALRSATVARELLLPGGGQMHERSGELARAGVRRLLRGATEVRDRLHVLALAQVGLAVEERALEEGASRRPGLVRTAYALSHRNPAGAAGGASGLRGNPATGSGAL